MNLHELMKIFFCNKFRFCAFFVRNDHFYVKLMKIFFVANFVLCVSRGNDHLCKLLKNFFDELYYAFCPWFDHFCVKLMKIFFNKINFCAFCPWFDHFIKTFYNKLHFARCVNEHFWWKFFDDELYFTRFARNLITLIKFF